MKIEVGQMAQKTHISVYLEAESDAERYYLERITSKLSELDGDYYVAHPDGQGPGLGLRVKLNPKPHLSP
jgi:hypothetical protein